MGQAETEAGAWERVMGKVHSGVILRQRAKLLNHARQLARSGAHPDHTSILRHLESLEGFSDARSRLEDRAFRTQLDRVCALARGQAI